MLDTLSNAQQFNLAEMQQNITELQAALLSAHPEMPSLLRKIHTKLKADPELVTLLSEDEIAQVITGLKQVTNVSLISPAKAAKKSGPATAASRIKSLLAGSNISADDF